MRSPYILLLSTLYLKVLVREYSLIKKKGLSQKVEAFFYDRILYCLDYYVSETLKVSET